MFVFKAAVLGGGTMGGEIAQVIANADIPVVLKDVEQKFVDHALEKSREVTKSQLDRLVSKEKLTQEQADARLDEVMGLINGTTTYDGFGDVDFVIEAVAGADGDQEGRLRRARRGNARSRDPRLQHLLALDHRDGPRDAAPAQGRRLPLLLPGVGDAAGRDHRAARTPSRETVTAAFNFAQTIRKQPITCGEVPGFVVNRILNSGVGEVWREQEEKGLSIKKIDEAIAAANVTPMGPFFLIDMLGLDTVLHVAEHLNESYGERFYVHKGMQKLVADGKLGRQVGRRGLLRERRAARSRATPSPTARSWPS